MSRSSMAVYVLNEVPPGCRSHSADEELGINPNPNSNPDQERHARTKKLFILKSMMMHITADQERHARTKKLKHFLLKSMMMHITAHQESHARTKKLKNDFRENIIPLSNHRITDVESLTDGVPIGNHMDFGKVSVRRYTGNSCDKMQRQSTIFRTIVGKIISSVGGFLKNEIKMDDIRKGERENMDEEVKEKYAYLLAATSYAILYIILSADLSRNNNAKVMMGVRLLSLVLMLALCISYSLRHSRVANVARTIAWGLLFISTLFISVLLQLTLFM